MQKIIKEDIEKICGENLPWSDLKNKKILITGANGFLGSYIVFSLIECNVKYKTNITIFALCRNKEKAFEKFKDYWNDRNLHFIFQDVCEDIDDKYRSDIIIHAASPANPYVVLQEPYKVIEANVIAYDHLIKKAKAWNTRNILLFSSSAVYGYSSPISGADENFRDSIDFTNYKDVYCLSKQMCEMMTICLKKECDINIKVIRPFVVYGPGDDLTHKKAMIDFLKNCLLNENIILKSKGDAVRSYIYVRDAIRAVFYIILKGNSDVYNIASENNVYSIKQVAELFCECSGNIKVEYQNDKSEYLITRTNMMAGRCEKLRSLGWTDEIQLKEGILRTIRWGKDMVNSQENRGDILT